MGSGIFNLIAGAVMLVGGLSGQMVFIGTGSSTLLSVVGAAVSGLGVYQIVRARRRRG